MSRFSIILLIILIIEIGFIVLGFSFSFQKVYIREKNIPAAMVSNFDNDSEITVFAVGDIMLDRGVELKIKEKGNGDYRWPFLKIAEYLQKADILFGNLEGPISAKGERVGSIYSFRAAPEAIEGLSFAGFDILSLANNHVFDYQIVALEDTMNILKENGIDYVGAGFNGKEAFSVKIKELKNTKIGFLALTDLGPQSWRAGEKNSGIAWINKEDIEEIKEHIKTAKQKVDVLIVSFHSGEEYSQEPFPSQVSFGRLFVDAGADLVIGHHSHVIQKIEKYKTGTIAYSLGNFIFDQGFSQETMEGLILAIIIENGKIKEVNPKKIEISNSFQPEITEKPSQKETSAPSPPQVYISSDLLQQGDTLLIKIESDAAADEIRGKLESTKIDFFKPTDRKDLVGITGIDAGEEPGKYNLVIDFPEGEQFKKEIEIIERKFPITELLVTEKLKEKGFTPSKILENIFKENLALKEVLSGYTAKAYFNKAFRYPLEKIEDVGAFGNIRKSGDAGTQHLGVDLAAELGTPVYAVNAGAVCFSEDLNTYGKTLIIDHGFGIYSLYLHLSEFKVLNRALVKRGEIIGLSGDTGYSIAPHLHFSVKVNGSSVDPLKFIKTIEEILK